MKLNNETLSSKAREAIIDMISKNSESMSKLPSENELSKLLGVSRNTIREALKSLENEGIVTARHGVGTFVVRDIKNIKSNLSVLESSTKIITQHGYVPGTESINFTKKKISGRIANELSIQSNSDILYIDRIRTADEKPVIYVEDYIIYLEGMYEKFNNYEKESIFEFLQIFGINMSFSSCNVYAIISDEKLEEKLCLNNPSPLLYLQQVHYSSEGIPVMYSDSYFLGNKFDFNLIRKVIN